MIIPCQCQPSLPFSHSLCSSLSITCLQYSKTPYSLTCASFFHSSQNRTLCFPCFSLLSSFSTFEHLNKPPHGCNCAPRIAVTPRVPTRRVNSSQTEAPFLKTTPPSTHRFSLQTLLLGFKFNHQTPQRRKQQVHTLKPQLLELPRSSLQHHKRTITEPNHLRAPSAETLLAEPQPKEPPTLHRKPRKRKWQRQWQ